MTDIQRADSAARRKAIIIVIISLIVGSLLMVVFETFRTQLNEWPLSDRATIDKTLFNEMSDFEKHQISI